MSEKYYEYSKLEAQKDGLSVPFDDFIYLLRNDGIEVATSSWIELQKILQSGEILSLNDFYIVSRSLLIKHPVDIAKFNAIFRNRFLDQHNVKDNTNAEREEDQVEESVTLPDSDEKIETTAENIREKLSNTLEDANKPHLQKQLGTQELTEDIPTERNGQESKHGGKEDQHNDILRRADKNKIGGGTLSRQHQGDKNKTASMRNRQQDVAQRPKEELRNKSQIKEEKSLRQQVSKSVEMEELLHANNLEFDADALLNHRIFGRILSQLRSIIQEKREVATKSVNSKATTRAIASKGGLPHIVFNEVIETPAKLIMLVDVGGSVDSYRNMILSLIRGATKGSDLDNVEVYFFHNAIYGYVWPERDGNWPKNEIALERILRSDEETKLIVIGDAWMSEEEYWGYGFDNRDAPKCKDIPPRTGNESFELIKKQYGDRGVWINPLRAKEYDDMDRSGTINTLSQLFPMFEMTYKGLESAVNRLMEAS